MRKLHATLFLAILVSFDGVLAQPTPNPTPKSEWKTEARFLGRIVGMSLESEDLPTLPVGYDPRYQMRVEVLAIHDGPLPVKPGGRLAFQIHSPSLFFLRYLGKKPTKFEGYYEGPFEFTIVRKPMGEGRAIYDLRIETAPTAPSPAPSRKQ